MPKPDDVALTNLTAQVDGVSPPGAVVDVVVHNLTDAEIPEDALTIGFFGDAQSGQTQSSAAQSFRVAAIPANSIHTPGGPMQMDPGDWLVSAALFDSETDDLLARHEAIPVHVPGAVHAAQSFDDTVKHDVSVQIQSVEHLSGSIYRVHYLLANNGQTTVPAGMLVRALIAENDDTLAWQDYHFEMPCPPGPPDPKYLTLEGSTTFTNASVFVMADPGGPSEFIDQVEATVAADGSVSIAR
jgi:hypothetical protein